MSNYRDKNDFDGSINGFCIGLKKGNTSYGYIIYNVEKYSVIEYCIQKNQENMYDSICSNQELENDSIEIEYALYTEDNIEYFILVSKNEGSTFYSNSGNEKESIFNSTSVTKNENWYSIIKKISTYKDSASYILLKSASIPQEVYFSEEYIEKYTKKYACAVVAMLEVCAQNDYFNYRTSGSHALAAAQIAPAFNYLWNVSQAKVYEVKKGISYGSVYDSYIENALCLFASSYAHKTISATCTQNPSYNVFTNAVDKGKSSILSARIYVKEDGKYVSSGHSVSVTGYAYYRSLATNNYCYFLKIADGWNDSARYIIFDQDNFISSQATVVN